MKYYNLSNVILAAIEGRPDEEKINLAQAALLRCCERFSFKNVILFTNQRPAIEFVHIKEIKPLNGIQDYSNFVLNDLNSHIKADYVMLVQSDGFIVNPDKWEDQFLAYDYIGAPWPANWPQSAINRVGNGGFSIRSKKVLELSQNIFSTYPEDNTICLYYKDYFEANGVKFAPADVASRFSWEHDVSENTPNNSFGFHGKHTPVHVNYTKSLTAEKPIPF